MNHREIAKRVLRIANGTEPTEDQVDRLVDARKDGLRMRFVGVVALVSPSSPSSNAGIGGPFRVGDVVECIDAESAPDLVLFREYRISELEPGWVYLEGPFSEISWRASRFRLVSRPTSSASS